MLKLLWRSMGVLSLLLVIYMGTIIAVHAQGEYQSSSQSELNQVETELGSDKAKISNLEHRLDNIESEKLDARISVIENSMSTSLKLQIGICLAMMPILLDIFRRWGRGRAQKFEVDTDPED